MQPDTLRLSDAAVVARFLQLRSLFHDRHLARVEQLILTRYLVQPTRRLMPTLVANIRTGFVRPGEGELWPVVFMTPVDISLGLCVDLSPDRVSSLGTMVKGPQRIRQRGWEGWWGWETTLPGLRPSFFDLDEAGQDAAVNSWFTENLEWLATGGLLLRRKV